jgi:hypothetical protein
VIDFPDQKSCRNCHSLLPTASELSYTWKKCKQLRKQLRIQEAFWHRFLSECRSLSLPLSRAHTHTQRKDNDHGQQAV